MIIVSQDRKTIVNFNNVLKIDCVNDEIIVFYKSEEVPGVDGTESIGFYGTEERIKIDEEENKQMLSKEEIKCCKQEAKNYIEFWGIDKY